MGCRLCKKKAELKGEEGPATQYSWEKRDKVDPKDFTIENQVGGNAGRLPGTVNGQQFIIQNCTDCNIYIFDHCSQVTVDDCKNCRIFIGPIKGSIFVRDCSDCKVVTACQQFRTRDCKKIDSILCCVSQPIIEASTGMRFGCYRSYYPALEGQFKEAGLSVFNNNWSNIHDFTPVPGENNFTLLAEDAQLNELMPSPETEDLAAVGLSLSAETSVVPQTLGLRPKTSDESCLILFFNDGGSHDRSFNFIKNMKEDCTLVQSKEITMQQSDAERVLGTKSYDLAVQNGTVIGFEYSGPNVCGASQAALVELSLGTTGLVFVSNNPQQANEQIENFFNFANMQMNA